MTEAAADAIISVEEENRLGEQMAAQIAQKNELLQDSPVTTYVRELGQKVAAQAEDTPDGINYSFNVIEAPDTVNAFAIPGGHIYVYTGLLRQLEDEAELMAVLSHEVAHVAERHVAEQLVAQYGLQALQQVLLGQDAGLLGQLVANVTSQGYLLKHSRDAEREADRRGLRYQVAAGYDPHGFIDFFQRLEGQGAQLPAFLLTHPPPEQRIENIRDQIEDLGQVPQRTNQERYQDMIAELPSAPETGTSPASSPRTGPAGEDPTPTTPPGSDSEGALEGGETDPGLFPDKK